MTGTDLLLLAVIGISALLGLMRGFIGVLASLVAWVLAAWVAFRFGATLALVFAGGAEPGAAHLLAGYGLSFVGVVVCVGLVAWCVRQLVRSIGLSGLDRALGLVLGLARGGLVACLMVLLMGFTTMPREPDWQQSQVLPTLVPGAQWLRGWLPEWAARRVDLGRDSTDLMTTGDVVPSPPDNGA